MQARTTAPRPNHLASWRAGVVAVALLLLLLLSFALDQRSTRNSPGVTPSGARIAYLEFGAAADTLWLADPANPARRERAFAIPHAREFGAVPSVAPDGRSFVYAALPPTTASPGPDAPAELWLATTASDARPRLLASGIDLRVKPVWSADGDSVVYRRSPDGGYALALLPLPGGAERVLAVSSQAPLFPVGLAPGGDFYYVALDAGGSTLLAAGLTGGSQRAVAHLADGLTRDWALSPDGSKLAFLAFNVGPAAASSQAFILDLATGTQAALTGTSVDAFGPVWSSSGGLIVGSLSRQGSGGFVQLDAEKSLDVPAPARGFEVPLAAAPAGGGYVVRAFQGSSALAPGPSTLTFIGADGVRRTIASGEVSFVGWRP